MRINNSVIFGYGFFRRFLLALASVLFVPAALANFAVPPGFNFSLPDGSSFDVGCGLLDVQGELIVNSANVTGANVVDIGSTGVIDAGSGTLFAGEGWNNNGTFIPGSSTLIIDDSCGETNPFVFTGDTIFNNLTIISTTGRVIELPTGSHLQVNGTLTLQGSSAQPLELVSAGAGQAIIRLGPDAQVISDNVSLSSVRIGNQVEAIPSLGTLSLWLLTLMVVILGRSRLVSRSSFRNR
ncbi:hypothetical protein [Halopseudomonas salegens]|uniref:IPTL-CTERM protein sorting domain-containing protein n=1 Tax=Halopseudomonas salegens TaxID=1434072 RepID=A0A1H2HJ92_9GAMM|nr:hypothetical protein [Halopseudomonas salegens]SDU31894.1 hypothetical protein SAMN05216210_3082 [Halopseudomonas salegens]